MCDSILAASAFSRLAGFLANFAAEFWILLCAMAPYLLFGFLAAGLLSVLVSPRLVERHLGGHGLWPVLKATLFGIPLPLCSCSVIPVTASLRRHGAGRGAAAAFLIATPQTGVDSILVTFSLLGPVFAVFKPLAALVSGVVGGAIVDMLEPHGEGDVQAVEPCAGACCAGASGHGRLHRILEHGFVELPRDIGRPLLIGVLAAAVIATAVPKDFFVGVGTGIGAILVMMLLGIPVYVCATASIPVAAALMLKGVSPGAALAFLMTGPATNAAGIAAVWKIMGPRTALVYLGTVAATAFASGVLLDFVLKGASAASMGAAHEMLPEPVKVASAIVLLAVLGVALFRRAPVGHSHLEADAEHEEDEAASARAGAEGHCPCHEKED